MSKYTPIEDWKPVDGFQLEDSAMSTVFSQENTIVVAGPGAGKTELLAQRACFLLQTNTCKNPHKILAISFKRDAAYNLVKRVEERLGKGLASRFKSMTYDSFAKGLVDRFRNGLPIDYRPKENYVIETGGTPQSILSLFLKYDPVLEEKNTKFFVNAPRDVREEYINSLSQKSYPLTEEDSIARDVLYDMLKLQDQSMVMFPIILRLAKYLLESNPLILKYLRQTYSHVFLDEFQDTTGLQYDLLKTAFLDSSSILTAVGDTKQRIMLWAGALEKVFKTYAADFEAERLSLVMNFRSAPRLVRLQNHLTKTLLQSNIVCKPQIGRNEDEGVAEFWIFKDEEQEAKYLAKDIRKKIQEQKIDPREICILHKQLAEHNSKFILQELLALNINSRIENDLQDLLNEPIVKFCFDFLESALDPNAVDQRERLLEEYRKFNKLTDDKLILRLERNLIVKLKNVKARLAEIEEWSEIEALILAELDEISYLAIKSVYPGYNEVTFYKKRINGFLRLLKIEYDQEQDLLVAIKKLGGEGSVPIMTIHKSKGLEFSIIYFVGFEDENFWNFKKQPREDTCTFFVALSRAKEEVYFTFARIRTDKWERRKNRSAENINPLLKALETSNLVEAKDLREINS